MNQPSLSFQFKLQFFEARYQEARTQGDLPAQDPLAGVERDVRLAAVINGQTSGAMFEDLLERVAMLDEVGMSPVVTGELATLLHTRLGVLPEWNIDVLLMASYEAIGEVEWAGFDLLAEPEEFIWETNVIPCRDPKMGVRVDFILVSRTSPYGQQVFSRARMVQVGEAKVKFASVEDVIIHKVIAGRPRDMETVKILLTENRDVDVTYIRHWLHEFSTTQNEPFLERFNEVWEPAANNEDDPNN